MRCLISKFDLTYEAVYRAPAIQLAGSATLLLQSLVGHLAPRYFISASDMQVFGGSALADVRVRVRLFSGNGTIEATAEKFTANFTNAADKADVQLIKDCITLGLQGLRKTLQEIPFRSESLRLFLTIDLKDEGADALSYLNSLTTPRLPLKNEDFGATSICSTVRLEVDNSTERWTSHIDLMMPFDKTAKSILMSFNTIYHEGTLCSDIEQKGQQISNVLKAFFAAHDLQPETI